MFKHILLPLDLQTVEETFLETVRSLAADNQAKLTLLHVIEKIAEVEDPEMEAFYKRLAKRARGHLEPLVEAHTKEGFEAELLVRLCHRPEEIVRSAAERDADLIALRSRSVHETSGGAWPTLSIQVAMLATLPVLLLR